MKFIVFYLQLINSLEGLGMFFSSAVLTRRLRKHTATRGVNKSFHCREKKRLQILRELLVNQLTSDFLYQI